MNMYKISRNEDFHWVACMAISHLTWPFSPSMGIFTSHGYLLPHIAILSLHGHFHLTWPFSPCAGIFNSHNHFPPCMAILTSYMWAFSPYVPICHLTWPFSPCVGTLPQHQKSSNMRKQKSHLACILCAPLQMKIIFFTSCRKNSQKKSQSNPNFINKVPLRATNYFCGNINNCGTSL